MERLTVLLTPYSHGLIRKPVSDSPITNPFPGLRPFEYSDSHLFFGREAQTSVLYGKLVENNFVAVVGTSGSGKSSLVKAGLLPRLKPNGWRFLVFRPMGNPLVQLATALVDSSLHAKADINAEKWASARQLFISRATARLSKDERELKKLLTEYKATSDSRILIVVDQFEEIFRYPEAKKSIDYDERARLVNHLLHIVQADDKVHVLLTMRSEFLGECPVFPGLAEAINDSQFLTPRLTRSQRKAAIIKPIEYAGGSIENELLQRLLNDVGNEPDQLPVMQHSLMLTWREAFPDKHLTLTHYKRSGGMHAAIDHHAEAVYNDLLSEGLGGTVEKVFKALSEYDRKGRAIRRPQLLSELIALCNGDKDSVLKVIDAFRRPENAFLTPPPIQTLHGDTVIDISHEALIRKWKRLADWMKVESNDGQIYSHLSAFCLRQRDAVQSGYLGTGESLEMEAWWKRVNPNEQWANRFMPEHDEDAASIDEVRSLIKSSVAHNKRQRTVKKLLMGGTIVSLIVATLTFYFENKKTEEALTQTKIAQEGWKTAQEKTQRALEEAERTGKIAEDAQKVAETAQSDAEKSLVVAKEATESAEQERIKAERRRDIAARALEKIYKGRAKTANELDLEGESATAMALLLESLPDPRSTSIYANERPFNRDVLNQLQLSTSRLTELPPIQYHSSEISALAVNTAQDTVAIGSIDGYVSLVELNSHELLAVFDEHVSEVLNIDFSSNGDNFITTAVDSRVLVTEIDSGNVTELDLQGTHVNQARFLPDSSENLLVAGDFGQLAVWNSHRKRPINHGDILVDYHSIDYLEGSNLLITSGQNVTGEPVSQLWRWESSGDTGVQLTKVIDHEQSELFGLNKITKPINEGQLLVVEFAEDAIVHGLDGYPAIYSIGKDKSGIPYAENQWELEYETHDGIDFSYDEIGSVKFAGKSSMGWLTDDDGVQILNFDFDENELYETEYKADDIAEHLLLKNGNTLLGMLDGSVRVRTQRSDSERIITNIVHKEGRELASVFLREESTVKLVDLRNNQEIGRFETNDDINGLYLSEDAQYIAETNSDTIIVRNTQSLSSIERKRKFHDQSFVYNSEFHFVPEADSIVFLADDLGLYSWNFDSNKINWQFVIPFDSASVEVLHEQGQLLVWSDNGEAIRVDLPTGTIKESLKFPIADVEYIALAVNGDTWVASTYEDKVYAWSEDSSSDARLIFDLKSWVATSEDSYFGEIYSLAVGLEGKYVAVGTDTMAYVIDVPSASIVNEVGGDISSVDDVITQILFIDDDRLVAQIGAGKVHYFAIEKQEYDEDRLLSVRKAAVAQLPRCLLPEQLAFYGLSEKPDYCQDKWPHNSDYYTVYRSPEYLETNLLPELGTGFINRYRARSEILEYIKAELKGDDQRAKKSMAASNQHLPNASEVFSSLIFHKFESAYLDDLDEHLLNSDSDQHIDKSLLHTKHRQETSYLDSEIKGGSKDNGKFDDYVNVEDLIAQKFSDVFSTRRRDRIIGRHLYRNAVMQLSEGDLNNAQLIYDEASLYFQDEESDVYLENFSGKYLETIEYGFAEQHLGFNIDNFKTLVERYSSYAEKVDPNKIPEIYERASKYISENTNASDIGIEQRIAWLDYAIKLHRENPEAWLYRSRLKRWSGQFEKALVDINKSLELLPKNLLAFREKTLALTSLDRFEEAEIEIDKAMAIDEEQESMQLKAALNYLNGQPSKALSLVRKIEDTHLDEWAQVNVFNVLLDAVDHQLERGNALDATRIGIHALLTVDLSNYSEENVYLDDKLAHAIQVAYRQIAQANQPPIQAGDCETLASHKYDPFAIARSVEFFKIDVNRAEKACADAADESSGHAKVRNIFLHGRVLRLKGKLAETAGDVDASDEFFDKGFQLLRDAEFNLYPIAINNINVAYNDGEGPDNEDFDGRGYSTKLYNIAALCCGGHVGREMYHQENTASDKIGDFQTAALLLLNWSASLGNPEAHEYLAEIAMEKGILNSESKIDVPLYHLALAKAIYAKRAEENTEFRPIFWGNIEYNKERENQVSELITQRDMSDELRNATYDAVESNVVREIDWFPKVELPFK